MLQIIFAYFSKCVHCVFLHKCKQFAKASVTNNLDAASFSGFFFDRSEYWWVRIYFRISVAFAFSSYSHYYANFFSFRKEKRYRKKTCQKEDNTIWYLHANYIFCCTVFCTFFVCFSAVIRSCRTSIHRKEADTFSW